MNLSDQASGVAGSALIQLRGLCKTYRLGAQEMRVLVDVSLDIRAGEFAAIVGQSGSGKTTLMNLIGCLDTPSAGSYRFDGEDVTGLDADGLAALRRDSMGFVFQRYNLLGNASAAENVEIPAVYAGMASAQRRERACELLTTLGLADRRDHRPGQLSGGQQQRVCIARALMNGGRLILADEPTGALDSRSGAEVMALLHHLNGLGHTIILVTHDDALARQAGRRIEIKDGRIVADSATAALCASAADAASPARARNRPLSWSELGESVRMALRSLQVNLFRSALTLLGIVIGVASVIAMLALGDGSKQAVLERIQAMGTDLLIVRPGARGVRISGEATSLVAEDAEALAGLPNVVRAVPEYSGGAMLRAGDNDYASNVTSTSEAFASARDWPLAGGSFFSAADVLGFAPVAVLGQTVANNLFAKGVSAVGRQVLINNVPFQVIGVMAAKGATSSGSDMDDVVLIPITTGRVRLFGKRYVRSIIVQVQEVEQIEATQRAIQRVLTQRHRREDFQIRNMADVLDAAQQTQDSLTWLLGSVAAISLLVGGIGVMNIMLVSVTERVREIGVRMAIGARMRNIMLQFNIEALVVCCVGGVLGVGAGLGAAWLAGEWGRPVIFSMPPVAMAFASAVLTGLLFGFLPARRAAAMDPVVALSAE